MTRPLLLVLALALLVAGGAQLARADGGGDLIIAPSDGGAARTLALASLAGGFDVHGATYTVLAADGTESTTTVADGISLNALLTATGLDADTFDYIALEKGDGSSAIVMRDDLGGTDEGPPVVWSDDQGVHFLRPSGGRGDQNGADLLTLAGGAPLRLTLKRGQPLVARIQVSTLRARPHERVDFSASLAGGVPLGPGFDYSWYFDGFGTARGANVSKRFPPGGPYLVLLNVVRGDGTSVGSSASVEVHVVRPRERQPRDAQGAGGGNGDGAGQAGSGGGTGGGAGMGGGGAGDPAPTYEPPPTTTAPAPPPSHAPRHVPTPPPAPRGELVSGTLIASASPVAAPAGGVRAAVAKGAASDGPLHVPVGAWVAIGLVALLALGWVLESRHTIPFWQP